MHVRENYKPVQVGVNSTVTFYSNLLGGFIAKTSGTVTITTAKGATIVDAFPVTEGQLLPLPFHLPEGEQQGTVTTAGGASGILGV